MMSRSMLSMIAACLAVAIPCGLSAQQYEVDSYIVVDLHSKKILSSKNATKKRQVASLTKVAAVMVALDWSEATKTDLSQLAVVPPSALEIGGPNPLGLQVGDRITLRDAIYAAVIGSDNLCAETIAMHVGRDLLLRSGERGTPVGKFVKEMNNLAKIQGCEDTRFTNPHGMDHMRPVPYSTAADMARLSIYAMQDAGFRFYCSQKERKISFQRGGVNKSFMIRNTNKLLGQDKIDGVKTGLTRLAGACLIVSAERPSTVEKLEENKTRITPHRLVVVVLGASDRFGASRSLLARGWQKYDVWASEGRIIRKASELLAPPAG
ncbi:MAG: serine hydrolase [Verrucomicrobiota bacterium]